jgi:predicted nucleic acid-binding protein
MVALYSEDDAARERCDLVLKGLAPPLLTCWPVLTEAAWLLRKRPDALARLFEGFAAGLFALLPLDADDLAAIAAIMHRYRDARLQLADAALAEREGIRTIFTLDRRADVGLLRQRGRDEYGDRDAMLGDRDPLPLGHPLQEPRPVSLRLA